jgi:hypothetical protein
VKVYEAGWTAMLVACRPAASPRASEEKPIPAVSAENRIPRAQLPERRPPARPRRSAPAEIGKRLGRGALDRVACLAKPGTILG